MRILSGSLATSCNGVCDQLLNNSLTISPSFIKSLYSDGL